MKKMIGVAVSLLFASLLSACAAIETDDQSEAKEETVYVTGSNLPKRDRSGVKTVSKEAMENSTFGAGPSITPLSGK